MIWKEMLPYVLDILKNIDEQRHCRKMISAYQEDAEIDVYLDTQPGGGNCLETSYDMQDAYRDRLDELKDLTNLFPIIQEKDIQVIEILMDRFSKEYYGSIGFENDELLNIIVQGFEFVQACPVFAEQEITKNNIDTFISAGKYISQKMVAFDSENERFYRLFNIEEKIDDLTKALDIVDDKKRVQESVQADFLRRRRR